MAADHDRYDQLALGHVLGGLSGTDEHAFRTHLRGCRDCRSRVAELRDIAADLVQAEADERARVPLRTDLDAPEDGEAEEVTPTRSLRVGHVLIAGLVVLVLAVGVLFWNLHLRTLVGAYDQAMTAQAGALSELAAGESIPVDLAEGVAGRVIVGPERVAFTLTGVEVADGEVAVAWLVDVEGGARKVLRAPAAVVREGNLAGTAERQGAVELLVTLEDVPLGEAPSGPDLARSPLPRDG